MPQTISSPYNVNPYMAKSVSLRSLAAKNFIVATGASMRAGANEDVFRKDFERASIWVRGEESGNQADREAAYSLRRSSSSLKPEIFKAQITQYVADKTGLSPGDDLYNALQVQGQGVVAGITEVFSNTAHAAYGTVDGTTSINPQQKTEMYRDDNRLASLVTLSNLNMVVTRGANPPLTANFPGTIQFNYVKNTRAQNQGYKVDDAGIFYSNALLKAMHADEYFPSEKRLPQVIEIAKAEEAIWKNAAVSKNWDAKKQLEFNALLCATSTAAVQGKIIDSSALVRLKELANSEDKSLLNSIDAFSQQVMQQNLALTPKPQGSGRGGVALAVVGVGIALVVKEAVVLGTGGSLGMLDKVMLGGGIALVAFGVLAGVGAAICERKTPERFTVQTSSEKISEESENVERPH